MNPITMTSAEGYSNRLGTVRNLDVLLEERKSLADNIALAFNLDQVIAKLLKNCAKPGFRATYDDKQTALLAKLGSIRRDMRRLHFDSTEVDELVKEVISDMCISVSMTFKVRDAATIFCKVLTFLRSFPSITGLCLLQSTQHSRSTSPSRQTCTLNSLPILTEKILSPYTAMATQISLGSMIVAGSKRKTSLASAGHVRTTESASPPNMNIMVFRKYSSNCCTIVAYKSYSTN